jgi:hypothetical protein
MNYAIISSRDDSPRTDSNPAFHIPGWTAPLYRRGILEKRVNKASPGKWFSRSTGKRMLSVACSGV